MQASNYVCTECNAAYNSYLFLRNSTHILCAYIDYTADYETYTQYDYSSCSVDADGYYTEDCVPTTTDYYFYKCTLDSASYPYDYQLYQDFYYYYYDEVYVYNLTVNSATVYLCFNEYLYFTGTDIYDI